jgi:cell wall-associated NlpC family hydrolase
MTTQILFGELYKIFDENDNWVKIELEHDKYTGWIDKKTVNFVSEFEYNNYSSAKTYRTKSNINIIYNKNSNQKILISSGSRIPVEENIDNRFCINNINYEIQSGLSSINLKQNFNNLYEQIIETAKSYINSPYLWGGRNILGIDCSGFTQIVYLIHNIKINRDASQQAKQGENVINLEQSKPCDLAFFENDKAKITHVGILINSELIIHASGKVRIDSIDQNGIYNQELEQYTHKLCLIKRLI